MLSLVFVLVADAAVLMLVLLYFVDGESGQK